MNQSLFGEVRDDLDSRNQRCSSEQLLEGGESVFEFPDVSGVRGGDLLVDD